MVTGGNRAAQPASPPQGICLCFLAAKFLSGGAPKRNCRLLSTVSYALLPRVAGAFCIQYRVVLCSNTQIQGGLFINFSTHSLTHTHTHTHTDACEGTDRGLCLSPSLCTFTQYHIWTLLAAYRALREERNASLTSLKTQQQTQEQQPLHGSADQ